MLGEQALALIRDVFGQPALFADLPRITRRVVAWGPAAQPIAVEHSARVISEDALLQAIRPSLPAAGQGRWTIFASRPLPVGTADHPFGSRTASVTPVTLQPNAEPGACWIESMDDGWLFLIPHPPRSGWMLAIGAALEVLKAESRMVASEIAGYGPPSDVIPAYARVTDPLCGPCWLACGTAAMSFDPICGDGTAQAIREAILAAAVIRALINGGDERDLFSHYETRLIGGFRRHLQLCQGFYELGGSGPLWRHELDAIRRGIQWCDAKLQGREGFRYRLRGFELEAVT